LDKVFDQLINSFIENKIGISEGFLTTKHRQELKSNMAELLLSEKFKPAGTSNEKVAFNMEVRSDHIYWLDRSHLNVSENAFLDLIDAFIAHLNATCYVGITDYEFHYAHYAEGSFYTKHRDQFKSNDNRKYSMIFYLNDAWVEGDGGELCIHQADNKLQLVAPVGGLGVFFDSSELLHEVLLTKKSRFSITGWLKVSK
jgi:SM-20-related protein